MHKTYSSLPGERIRQRSMPREILGKPTLSKRRASFYFALFTSAIITGCNDNASSNKPLTSSIASKEVTQVIPKNPDKNAYFGDLHVHSSYSFDAFLFGVRAEPDDAYRFAQGASLDHVGGFEMKLKSPLDFFSVTDHGVMLGHYRAMADPNHPLSNHPDAKVAAQPKTPKERQRAFALARDWVTPSPRQGELNDSTIIQSSWAEIVSSANRHNKPGEFTAFIGYEYTTTGEVDQANLHRNVIFAGDKAPLSPFSRLDSENPEDLWQWMDQLRDQGIDSMAIPHNSNGSNGQMFSLTDFSGKDFTQEYSDIRMRNEPLVEISQIKGTSETHPELSPADQWANFEIEPRIVSSPKISKVKGSYVRDAYLEGLKLSYEKGFDPFRFGVVGSSDSHNGSSGGTEDDYFLKVGMLDAKAEDRGSLPEKVDSDGQRYYSSTGLVHFGASGLAGVWAEKNTREAIYNSMRQKETFGTSGTRIKLRFFAGYKLPKLRRTDFISAAYKAGVPMGGQLDQIQNEIPEFIVWATRDPKSAPLERVQIIKGWLSSSGLQEKVYDVACANSVEVNPSSHRCPDIAPSVNLEDCSYDEKIGSGELKTRWQDPDFNHNERAFYYVRVLESPICRWSTWDAIRAGVSPRNDKDRIINPSEGVTPVGDKDILIQERAWSSPIWYQPNSSS